MNDTNIFNRNYEQFRSWHFCCLIMQQGREKTGECYLEKTIFDFDVSRSELDILGVTKNRDRYISHRNEMVKLYHLHKLMKLRGDNVQAKKILREIYDTVVVPNMI